MKQRLLSVFVALVMFFSNLSSSVSLASNYDPTGLPNWTIFLPFIAKNNEITIFDATTSRSPSSSPGCYIYTGFNPPYATPQSVQIYWPISVPINNATLGTSTFLFWAETLWGMPITHIFVNGNDAGIVVTSNDYAWISIDFPSKWLNKGNTNLIEIWTSTTDPVAIGCGNFDDDVGEQNAIYIRENGGGNDGGPEYGKIYAKLFVRID